MIGDIATWMFKISMHIFCGLGLAMAYVITRYYEHEAVWFQFTLKAVAWTAVVFWFLSMAYVGIYLFNKVYLPR